MTLPVDDPGKPAQVRFHEVMMKRAHHEVIDQIIFAIRAGTMRVGDQLPTVETMAAMTNVSKPVIGEAIRVLREHDIVATKRGVQGGVTVTSDEIPADLLRVALGWREATLTELVEARKAIEEELALLAGIRGATSDFAQMYDSIERLKRAFEEDNSGGFLRYDHMFHYQIGIAAGSEMLAFYQHRILSESAAALIDYNLFHEVPELVISTHEAILGAIENRDVDAIREAVDWHWRTSSGAFATIEEFATNDGKPAVGSRK